MRKAPHDPLRWFFDFDPAAPGGKGGAGVRIDLGPGLVSIDGVHKNLRLPRRSTGALLAEGLRLAGFPQPTILEMYNVERSTKQALIAGSDGQGTVLGNTLADTAAALGATIVRWEAVPDGSIFHLRVHLIYP